MEKERQYSITVNTVFLAENITLAFENLDKKHDSCGIDGVKLSELHSYWELNGSNIVQAIRERKYIPGIVSLIELAKPNGKRRIIAKLNTVDRLILRAISQATTPIVETVLSDNAFAYREGKSTADAAGLAASFMNEGLQWVCETDIKDFFSSIRHDIMMNTLKRMSIFEPSLLFLVEKYINCRTECYGEEAVADLGLIQGSPLSPLLSNLYMTRIDDWLKEEGVHFVRFGDDINLYYEKMEEAYKFQSLIKEHLKEIGLEINAKKSGIYRGENRSYLGYEFISNGNKIIVKKASPREKQVYNRWRKSSIEKVDNTYHIVSSGILTRKDFTLLFENNEGKFYLPIETINSLNIYSDVTFSSNFFEFVSKRGVSVSLVNSTGSRIGSFVPESPRGGYKTELAQVDYRINEVKYINVAKKYQNANIFNLRAILRYYCRRNVNEKISETVEFLTSVLGKVNEVKSVNELLILEAQARQKYYHCFNYVLNDERFSFESRTKRPPRDAINAMISFGNTLLYQRFAALIYQSSLDIRFGILHNSYYRAESLNLDLADLFKPVLVDRTIFTLINKKMISPEDFQQMENNGVYLGKKGKRIFIKEFEQKLKQTVKVGQVCKNYEMLMKDEVRKVEKFFRNGEKYKPYKYVN